MADRRFLSARVDDVGEATISPDSASVPWWSFTKTALATLALQLVARGQLSLDGLIVGRPYSLRQLLQHRAGVPDCSGLAAYHEAIRRGDKPWEVRQLLKLVAADQLDFEPGKGWRYSNTGYLLVRQMIEAVTGQDLSSVFRNFLFDRLELNSVRLVASAAELSTTAWGNHSRYDPGWVYHGLLVGTPGDAVRFLHRLMLGYVLPDALLKEMTKYHSVGGPLPNRPWRTTGYGLGLMIGRLDGAGFGVGHSGAGPSSANAVYHFGDRPLPCTVAAFAQGNDEGVTEHEAVRIAGFA